MNSYKINKMEIELFKYQDVFYNTWEFENNRNIEEVLKNWMESIKSQEGYCTQCEFENNKILEIDSLQQLEVQVDFTNNKE